LAVDVRRLPRARLLQQRAAGHGPPPAAHRLHGHARGRHDGGDRRQLVAGLPLLRRVLPGRHGQHPARDLRGGLGGRRRRGAALLAHHLARAQARDHRHHPALLHHDHQRLQHHLCHDPRRAGLRHPGVRDLLVPGGLPAIALGPRRHHLHLPGAAAGGGHRSDQPLSSARGAGQMTRILTIAGLVLFLLVILVPFWWIASMSFKTYEQIQFASSIYVPRPFTWENYTGLWSETRFPLWLRNSVVTALVVTLISTVVAALAGYAVARIRFPGREAVASIILIVYLIPLYRVLAELGATNSLFALFLSYPTFTVPFCTWLLIGFFKALPDELEEAALIDGAGRITAFVRVLLPLAAPGLVASAIFAFTLSWNEFLYALVFIQDEKAITV